MGRRKSKNRRKSRGKNGVRHQRSQREESSRRRDLPTASLEDAETSGRISIPKSPILVDIKRLVDVDW